MAAVAEAAEEGVDEGLVAQEVRPFGKVEIGGDNGRTAMGIALLHHFEEDVGLLGLEVEVAELVADEQIKTSEPVEQLARGAVGERGVHVVEEILGAEEEAAMAVLQRL